MEKVKQAENYINEISPAIINADSELIKEAMYFRVEHKKKKVSMADCISYIMAKN